MITQEILDPPCRGCASRGAETALLVAYIGECVRLLMERSSILALAESPGATVETLVKAIKERG